MRNVREKPSVGSETKRRRTRQRRNENKGRGPRKESFSVLSIHHLLRIDSAAGLSVGGAMIVLDEWLSKLYAISLGIVHFVALANVAYGLFSLSLVMRRRRTSGLIKLLAIANGGWAIVCLGLIVHLWPMATFFGIAHVALEGVFVGHLATLEWKQHDRPNS